MDWNQFPEWACTTVKSLLHALKERDPYTYAHCLRVAQGSRQLAAAAGLDEYQQQIVELAGLFHDLGKIGIPDGILLKQGPLTPDEEAIMRTHPVRSAEVLSPFSHIPFFRFMFPGIIHHHERIDGMGYPDRLRTENIPYTAKIIIIADTYDAITSSRPYRGALGPEVAYRELKKYSGSQFDSELVSIFLTAHPAWKMPDPTIPFSEEFIAAEIDTRLRQAAAKRAA